MNCSSCRPCLLLLFSVSLHFLLADPLTVCDWHTGGSTHIYFWVQLSGRIQPWWPHFHTQWSSVSFEISNARSVVLHVTKLQEQQYVLYCSKPPLSCRVWVNGKAEFRLSGVWVNGKAEFRLSGVKGQGADSPYTAYPLPFLQPCLQVFSQPPGEGSDPPKDPATAAVNGKWIVNSVVGKPG